MDGGQQVASGRNKRWYLSSIGGWANGWLAGNAMATDAAEEKEDGNGRWRAVAANLLGGCAGKHVGRHRRRAGKKAAAEKWNENISRIKACEITSDESGLRPRGERPD